MWKSAFTRIVSHSSCESELMALDVGAMLSQFCGWLIQSMGGPLVDKVQVFVDNAGTISLSSNPIQPGRNVHVHARYFYVRDLVFSDKLQIEKIPTELQVADIGCSYKGAPNFLRLVRAHHPQRPGRAHVGKFPLAAKSKASNPTSVFQHGRSHGSTTVHRGVAGRFRLAQQSTDRVADSYAARPAASTPTP